MLSEYLHNGNKLRKYAVLSKNNGEKISDVK
jgi:hypothetical protein